MPTTLLFFSKKETRAPLLPPALPSPVPLSGAFPPAAICPKLALPSAWPHQRNARKRQGDSCCWASLGKWRCQSHDAPNGRRLSASLKKVAWKGANDGHRTPFLRGTGIPLCQERGGGENGGEDLCMGKARWPVGLEHSSEIHARISVIVDLNISFFVLLFRQATERCWELYKD